MRMSGYYDTLERPRLEYILRTALPNYAPIARGLPPRGMSPRGLELKVCREGPASHPGEAARRGRSLCDPNGGEWRWFPGDTRPNPHWDYKQAPGRDPVAEHSCLPRNAVSFFGYKMMFAFHSIDVDGSQRVTVSGSPEEWSAVSAYKKNIILLFCNIESGGQLIISKNDASFSIIEVNIDSINILLSRSLVIKFRRAAFVISRQHMPMHDYVDDEGGRFEIKISTLEYDMSN